MITFDIEFDDLPWLDSEDLFAADHPTTLLQMCHSNGADVMDDLVTAVLQKEFRFLFGGASVIHVMRCDLA